MIFEFSGNGPVNMVSGYTVTRLWHIDDGLLISIESLEEADVKTSQYPPDAKFVLLGAKRSR